MSKYVRITGIINNTPVAIGLLNNGSSFIISDDKSLHEITLSQIDEDFYTGDDTAPLYNGCIQYAFLEADAKTIAQYINSNKSLKTHDAKVVASY